jgi:hypothetical protein
MREEWSWTILWESAETMGAVSSGWRCRLSSMGSSKSMRGEAAWTDRAGVAGHDHASNELAIEMEVVTTDLDRGRGDDIGDRARTAGEAPLVGMTHMTVPSPTTRQSCHHALLV